ncbi:MAG: hypothetical protein U0Y82_13255 [Thermoleophilia bacterium]
MSDPSPAVVLGRVLRRTGLAFPRGMMGESVARLAAAMERPASSDVPLDRLVDAAAADTWDGLQPSVLAAVRMHLGRADGPDREDLAAVLPWAERDDPGNPLARALVVRAAQELAAALRRAERLMVGAEAAVAAGGRDGALAAARAVGGVVVALLDLDPEDFADEISAYVDAGEDAVALDTLSRSTGDDDTRGWARDAVRALAVADAPAATAAAHGLADGGPPPDPAADAVWVPTVLALVEEGFERALADEGVTGDA